MKILLVTPACGAWRGGLGFASGIRQGAVARSIWLRTCLTTEWRGQLEREKAGPTGT